jgi:hypothetical protein
MKLPGDGGSLKTRDTCSETKKGTMKFPGDGGSLKTRDTCSETKKGSLAELGQKPGLYVA